MSYSKLSTVKKVEKITKADTARLIGIIITAYPNIDKYSGEIIEAMTNTWALMFADDDCKLVTAAVMKHIATSKWAPSIAEIRSIMVDIQRPDILPPDMAWGMVSDYMYAERTSLLHSNLNVDLPPLVKRAVEIIGYNTLKEMSRGRYGNYREDADKQAFMETYVPMYERERQAAQLPKKTAEKLTERALVCGDSCTTYVKKAMDAREAADEEWRQRFIPRHKLKNED